MTETTGEEERRDRVARRRMRWIAAPLTAIAVIGAGIWIERRPIATGFVDRELARRGVPARYTIADLGFRTQRLTNVVIGDPTRPDLVADWVELTTDVSLSGARVSAIRAGQVRLRGRVIDGKLALGAIDRLLPPDQGKPFALPSLWLDVADARLRLDTPIGVVGAKLTGQGQLTNGFAGALALVGERFDSGACHAERVAAALQLRITDRQPILKGPLRAAGVECETVAASNVAADVDLRLDARLDRWRGRAGVMLATLRSAPGQVSAVTGTVDFDGGLRRTAGSVDLVSGAIDSPRARASSLGLSGRYHIGRDGAGFDGQASVQQASLGPAWRAAIDRIGSTGAGTPVGPLMAKIGQAGGAAARSFGGSADLRVAPGPNGYEVTLGRADIMSRSGAHATLSGGQGISVDARGMRVDGLLALTGGGLPEAALQLRQSSAGAPIRGSGFVRPYAAGGAQLALGDLDFTAARGATRITTRAVLSGPVADGRIERAAAPIAAYWNGQSLRLNPGCTPLTFERLRVASLALGETRVRVCAEGDTLLRVDGNRLSGAARLSEHRFVGKLGDTPFTLAIQSARYGFLDNRFGANGVAARLGDGDHITRLDLATLDGRIAKGGAVGAFAGADGRIAQVPLLLSDGRGDWRFDGDKLTLGGALMVADADPEPRFYPLSSRDVALTLADNRIVATGTLTPPASDLIVAKAAIAHDLGRGVGSADLAVPGIAFSEAFQPNKLTRFTYGVIAGVQGLVSGDGRIDWNPKAVTSSGTFRTAGANLEAAFGPIEGLTSEIHFTDLLNLVSAPGQEVALARVNPGVAVEGGVIRYQTLADQRVRIEGGRWPFAGGMLILDPAELDLATDRERRLTFRLEGVDAAQFLQQLDFKNLNATGTFDGVLPMIFDAKGGRIEGGELNVRPGGGTIAYVGEVSQENLGFWGNTAFQALKSLRYRNLTIAMNGSLAGEMITEVRFAGLSQGDGAKRNFLVRRLQQLPFVFNVRIKAPFRQLFDLADPGGYAKRVLSQSIVAPNTGSTVGATPVQPRASETVPEGEPK